MLRSRRRRRSRRGWRRFSTIFWSGCVCNKDWKNSRSWQRPELDLSRMCCRRCRIPRLNRSRNSCVCCYVDLLLTSHNVTAHVSHSISLTPQGNVPPVTCRNSHSTSLSAKIRSARFNSGSQTQTSLNSCNNSPRRLLQCRLQACNAIWKF